MRNPTGGGSVLGGALLVAGTCIGGGMLGLPVSTAEGGFWPSMGLFFVCWLCNLATALFIVEVTVWAGNESNFITMAQRSLGRLGKWACWILYPFLFYSLTVAYIAGGGDLLTDAVGNTVPEWMGSVVLVLLFAPCVYVGARLVDRINSVLMLGLGMSFVLFVILGVGSIKWTLLERAEPMKVIWALPISFVSFAFQGLVPTLTNYLDRDPVRVRRALMLGSSVPLFVYGIWQMLILGIVPYEELMQYSNAVAPLKEALGRPVVALIAAFFAFFAITTSLLGVSLALLDFLADGLSIKKGPLNKVLLLSVIFIPPMIFSWTTPGLFLLALGYAGGLGTALLLNLIPVLMVWRVRPQVSLRLLPGGYPMLAIILLFILAEVVIQFC